MQRDYEAVTATSAGGGVTIDARQSQTIGGASNMSLVMPMGSTVDVLDGGFAARNVR